MTEKDPVRISLKIDMEDPGKALEIGKALGVDDDDYITTRVEENSVIGDVEAHSIKGARRAADDWLACLMVLVKENDA